MAKQKIDPEKERKSRDLLMQMTEYDYYISLQYHKFFNETDKTAKEKCFFCLEDRIDGEKENIVNGVKKAAKGRLTGEQGTYDFWKDVVGTNAGQHLQTLHNYRIGDIVDMVYNSSGYKQDRVDEKAPGLTKHYNKTLSELAEKAKLGKEDVDKDLTRDYSAIMDLYTKALTIKYDRELVTRMGYKDIDKTLEQYYPKKQEKKQAA